MSFLCNHSEIGSKVLTPVVRHSTSTPFTGTSVVINLTAVIPQLGEIIFITIGGTATVTVTAPAGFVKIALSTGGGTMEIWYKIATGSETGSYTFSFSASLGGHWRDYIISLNTLEYPLLMSINEIGTSIIAGSNNPGPITNLPYNIFHPSLALSAGRPSVSDTGVSIDNSFVPGTGSQSGSFKAWERIYTTWALGEVTRVTTVTAVVTPRLTVLQGKRMF